MYQVFLKIMSGGVLPNLDIRNKSGILTPLIVSPAERPFPKMKNVHLRIPVTNGVFAVAQPVKRPPMALLSQTEEKLYQLLIADTTGTVAGAVLGAFIKDNGDLRRCLDMRRVNQAIFERKHGMLHTSESFMTRIKSCNLFGCLNFKDASHQVSY